MRTTDPNQPLGALQILPLIQSACACRLEMHSDMRGNKDLLYLDLALEGVIRGAIERGVGSLGLGAAAFTTPLLQNLVLIAGDNKELCYCLKAWLALPASVQYGSIDDPLRALQATAVVDRLRRALGALSLATSERVSPAARGIGESAGIGAWAVDLFAEEVVRGGPAFGVSLVLSTVEPALRRCAELGSWQVISPASVTGAAQGCTFFGVPVCDLLAVTSIKQFWQAADYSSDSAKCTAMMIGAARQGSICHAGRIVEIASLSDVQDTVYSEPTILLAQRVSGEEEIPEGVVAVITPDAPDILSHSSVRARNMKVLLATCHDAEPLEELRAATGQMMLFKTTAAGSVTWGLAEAGDLHGSRGNGAGVRPTLKISIPKWCVRFDGCLLSGRSLDAVQPRSAGAGPRTSPSCA